MPTSLELRAMQKRVLLMLMEVQAENSSPALRRHIRAIKTEMEAEDVAYVEKMFSEQ